MPRFIQVAFDEAVPAPEGGDGLPGRGVEQFGDLFKRAGHFQAAPASTEGCFDRDRQAVALGESHHLSGIGDRVDGAWNLRGTHLLRDVTSSDLVPQALDRLGRRANPLQARIDDGAGEVRVLSQEAVPRMHGVGSRAARHVQEFADVQIGVSWGGAVQGESLVRELDEQRIRV